MTTVIVAFLKFANAPKKGQVIIITFIYAAEEFGDINKKCALNERIGSRC